MMLFMYLRSTKSVSYNVTLQPYSHIIMEPILTVVHLLALYPQNNEVLDIHREERYIFRLLCKMQLKHPYESALKIGSLPYLNVH